LSTYRASNLKDKEVAEEFARVERALNEAQPFFELQVLHAEPKRMRPGMLILADGTDWDPGSGEGPYIRNAANNAWVFLA
jgi:hypothetical protein